MRARTAQRPRIVARLGAAVLCLLAAATQVASAQPRGSRDRAGSPAEAAIGVISGGVDGTYVRIAADLAAVLDDGTRLRVVPILGKGSSQNIDDIARLRGVDVGIVQSDVLAYIRQRRAQPGPDRAISYIAKLYDEEFHVLARREVGSLQELAGRPVNVDVRGSGTALTASIVFERLGIAVQATNDDQTTALDKLRRGEIAALAYVTGKPARLFSAIAADSGLHLLAVPMTPALLETYLPSQFGPTDYPALVPEGSPVDTIAVGAVMAVYGWQPGSDGYRRVARFVDAFFDNFAKFRQPPRHPKWREVSLEAQVPGWSRFPAAEDWLRRRSSRPAPAP